MHILGYFYFKGGLRNVDSNKLPSNLNDFILAALISEGQWDLETPNVLKIPVSKDKALYLAEILREEDLSNYVQVNTKNWEISIFCPIDIRQNYENWFEGNVKVFSKFLDPRLLTLNAIILCINLYGERQLEAIKITTNVETKYIKILAYCIEKHLKVPVVPAKNNIKITNVASFISNYMNLISAIQSTGLINYLTTKERKILTKEKETIV